MSHSHDHAYGNQNHETIVHIDDTHGKNLLLTMGLNLFIPICQLVGGILAQSMAVVSDAIHNFSDFTALFMAYLAHRISKRAPSLKFSFGYKRAEVLAALINVSLLFGACLFILFEALSRIRHPEPVAGSMVAILAGIGIVGNGLSVLFLRQGAKDNLNMRGAMLHMLADLFTSVVVFVNGVILMFKPLYWLDPLLSVFIVIFILKNSWSIIKQAGIILMEGVPQDMQLTDIKKTLENHPRVKGAHHLHVWNVGSRSIACTGHIVVENQMISETDTLRDELHCLLLQKFAINHCVLEFEHVPCSKEIVCPGTW